MSDNNIVSVKLGDKVYSTNEDGEHWDDVSATYNDVGGTLQTEFTYEEGGEPTPPTVTGGYFMSDDDKIWSLERWDGMDHIYASPLRSSWDGSKRALPLYFNTYVMPIIYSDYGLQHPVTEFPHEGDTFYYLDVDVKTVANVTLYSTMTAASTATDTPPTPPTPPAPPVTTYDKPLIYNKDLDCIEKSLGNIEVVGDMKAASVTTPSLIVTQPVEDLTVKNLTVTDTASINHATIVTEEDVHSEADFIELRVGNPLPTPSTGSGFKVKNYDGNNNDLELVTDSNGTFRIGAENSLQSILTRDEEADLANGAPLVWNAAQHKAQTTSTTDGNKVLKSVKNSTTGVVSYEWSSSGSGAVWRGTQAELTAALAITDPNDESYIPNNAMIIITDADNTYLLGEEQ